MKKTILILFCFILFINIAFSAAIFNLTFDDGLPPTGWIEGGLAEWHFNNLKAQTASSQDGWYSNTTLFSYNIKNDIRFGAQMAKIGTTYVWVGDTNAEQDTGGQSGHIPEGNGYSLLCGTSANSGLWRSSSGVDTLIIPTNQECSNSFLDGFVADRNLDGGWTLRLNNAVVGWYNEASPFIDLNYGQFYTDSGYSGSNNAIDDFKLEYNILSADITAPVTTVSGCSSGWHNTNQTITLTCTDDLNGCAATDYNLDFGGWQPYTLPFVLNTDLNHRIDYNSTDGNFNVEATNTSYCAIDETKPTMQSDANSVWDLVNDANIHLTCNDSMSGASAIKYRLDTNAYSVLDYGAWQTYDTNIYVDVDGNYGLQFYCSDNAGNDSNTGANYDTNYILIENGIPTTPTAINPFDGNYTDSVNVSCSAPTWFRDVNYVLDYNTGSWDWNIFNNSSLSSKDLNISLIPANTKVWFRCKLIDADKNGAYYTNVTSILVNPDSNFDLINNPFPSVPTIATSASAPFSVNASDSEGVNYCTFKIYKNGVFLSDNNGTGPATPLKNGTWSYTDTNVVNGDIVFSTIFCVDTSNNFSSNISTSTYSILISSPPIGPPGGGGSSPPPTKINFVTPSLVSLQASTLALSAPPGSNRVYTILIHNLTSKELPFKVELKDGLEKYLKQDFNQTTLSPGDFVLLKWNVIVPEDENYSFFTGYLQFNLNNGQEYAKQELSLNPTPGFDLSTLFSLQLFGVPLIFIAVALFFVVVFAWNWIKS